MSYSTKNKILIGALMVLLLANIATITVFWLAKGKHAVAPKGPPTEFIVKELGFSEQQKKDFLVLVQEHRNGVESLRQQLKTAKDNFFKLLQQPQQTDTEKTKALQHISRISEQLDLITFDHFKKVRALCNNDQQKKFDAIIQDVLRTTGGEGPGPGAPGMREQRPQGPPGGPEERRPPPPPGEGSEERPPPPR